MENILLKYNYEVSTSSKNMFVLSYKKRYYQIGEDLYRILSFGKETKDLKELHTKLKIGISIDDLSSFLNNNVIPLFDKNKDESADHIPNGFWFKRDILNEVQINFLSRPLKIFFGRLFFPMLALFIGINIILFQQRGILHTSGSSVSQELLSWVVSYFVMFLIIFLHELGHTAAALKSGIQPRSIGISFYTVLPVMYTDLTDCWKLNVASKLKINLAGVFIQLLLGTLFFLMAYFLKNPFFKIIIIKALFVNFSIIFLNLIPFMKFDGYWILSDLVRIPNLIKRSDKTLIDLFTKKGPFDVESDRISLNVKIFLIGYSILRLLFIVFGIFIVFVFIYYSFVRTYTLILNFQYLELNLFTLIEILKRICFSVIIYIFTRKYVVSFRKLIFKKNDSRTN